MTVEMQTQAGDWANRTALRQSRGPRVYRKVKAQIGGPVRAKRNLANRVRVLTLKERLEITNGTGNFMVNLCRDGAARSRGRREDAAYQRPAAGPHHPNERLRTYGMRVELDEEGLPVLLGGTPRQRRAYHRAMVRYLVSEEVLSR